MDPVTWTTIEACTAGWDPDQQGFSTRPNRQIAYPLFPVPVTPTDPAHPERRYLFQLATVDVPEGKVALIHHIRQAVVIGSVRGDQADPALDFVPLYQTVRDPFWHFFDGNATFSLRFQPGSPTDLGTGLGEEIEEGVLTNPYGQGTALLANPGYVADFLPLPGPPPVPYLPPNAGQPLGDAMGDLGYWEDLRFPWQHAPGDGLLVPPQAGAGRIVGGCSVAQTNPATRGRPLFGDVRGLRQEDQFVLAVPNVIYRYVGLAFLVDLLDLACVPALLDLARGGRIAARFLALAGVSSPADPPKGTP